MPLFENRREAGRQLAQALARYRDSDPVVLALPRGGVPVGFEVAKALGAPLDVLIVRKIGAPGHPELGIGAVIDGSEPHLVLNEDGCPPGPAACQPISRRRNGASWRRSSAGGGAMSEIGPASRSTTVPRSSSMTGSRPVVPSGRLCAASRACIRPASCWRCRSLPPTPSPACPAIATISYVWPRPSRSTRSGRHYRDFTQTEDEEVVRLLAEAAGLVAVR